jgi:MYXO-CTERM domain-containing protein
VIARVNQAYPASNSQQLLASLSLNTAGLPAAAPGYQYFLSSQADPGNLSGAYDVVVNDAPAPEPTGLVLLGVGTAPLLRRRRRT